jgi:hypothetical protein
MMTLRQASFRGRDDYLQQRKRVERCPIRLNSARPKIWDDEALEDWAIPIAALGVRPSQFTAAEYYAVPGENLRTYSVYRPDREPPGYWEWLQKQKPQPLVDPVNLRTRDDWIKAGEIAFQTIASTTLASGLATADPEKIKLYRDPKAYEGVWTRADGSLLVARWVVTDHGIELRAAACAGCHASAREDGTVFWGCAQGTDAGRQARYNSVASDATRH